MRLHPRLAACVLALASAQSFAGIVAGTTTGVWVDSVANTGVLDQAGLGTSQYAWGQSSDARQPRNSIAFTATAGFSSVTETPFKIGTISFFNGSVYNGDLGSLDLELTLDFGAPTIPSVTSDYTLHFVNTPNTGDPDGDADYVYLPSVFDTTTFLIDGVTYGVRLVAFENIVGDGFLASNDLALHVREDSSATADLYAVVTSSVPEPQDIALMLAGLGITGLMARRRRA